MKEGKYRILCLLHMKISQEFTSGEKQSAFTLGKTVPVQDQEVSNKVRSNQTTKHCTEIQEKKHTEK